MSGNITYRDEKGTPLTKEEVDANFRNLDGRVENVENNPPSAIGIEYFAVVGSSLFVHMTDSSVLGPYTIPTPRWTARGEWAPSTAYALLDVVTVDGSAYLVTYAHISEGSFDPGATSGSGNDWYGLLFVSPYSTSTLSARVTYDDMILAKTTYLCAPFDGRLRGLDVTLQDDLAIGGVFEIAIQGVPLSGTSVTITDAAVAGDSFSVDVDTPPPFNKGESLSLIPSGFDGLSGISGGSGGSFVDGALISSLRISQGH